MQRNIVFVTRAIDAITGDTHIVDVVQPGANDRHNFRLIYGIARERAADIRLGADARGIDERVEVAVEAHLQ